MSIRTLTVAAVLAGAAALAACSNEREAESKTPVAEAEVSTTQPESAISDQALQNAADIAAVTASQPEPGAMSTGTVSTGTMSDGAVTSSTTTTMSSSAY